MDSVDTTKAKAGMNDYFRKHTATLTLTRGLQELAGLQEVIQLVREFNDFNEGNDPYGEHDFGSFDWLEDTIFWKIDYYDPELSGYCDPLDSRCIRVLTVMLAEEY